ncbi:MAG: prolyl oligopeptidase family serine peptidase [Cellulosilyticaceae bacterium]
MNPIAIDQYKKILFLGDSITYLAQYVNDMDTYLTMHFEGVRPEIVNMGLSSETASGLSEAHHPFPRPCIFQRLEQTLDFVGADLVIACYGMNDGIYHPQSEARFEAYKKGILELERCVTQRGMDIVFLTPPPFDVQMVDQSCLQDAEGDDFGFMKPYSAYNDVLEDYGRWLMAEQPGKGAIDIYTDVASFIKQKRQEDPTYITGDGIHVNGMGHFLFMRAIFKQLFGITITRIPSYVEAPETSELYQLICHKNRLVSDALLAYIGHGNALLELQVVPFDELAMRVDTLQQQITQWMAMHQPQADVELVTFKGYEALLFHVKGRECILVKPHEARVDRPWVWRAEFFDAFSTVDMALVAEGWHIAYCNLSDAFGNPQAVAMMHDFYEAVIRRFELSQKADLFGFSRGGLYTMHYAVAYPETLRSIYLDAPVLDLCSWPGGHGCGVGSAYDWALCTEQYQITPQDAAGHFADMAVVKMAKLVDTDIPVILVAGDADEVVPYEENGERLVKAYTAKGKTVPVILKAGVGHHPHSLEEPGQIVTFIKDI